MLKIPGSFLLIFFSFSYSLSTQGEQGYAGLQKDQYLLSQADFALDYAMHFGLLTPEQAVVVRAYSDDTDEQMLAEIQPRYIIMFEPNLDFVRRIEVREAFRHHCHSAPMTCYCRRCIKNLTQVLALGCTCCYTTTVLRKASI